MCTLNSGWCKKSFCSLAPFSLYWFVRSRTKVFSCYEVIKSQLRIDFLWFKYFFINHFFFDKSYCFLSFLVRIFRQKMFGFPWLFSIYSCLLTNWVYICWEFCVAGYIVPVTLQITAETLRRSPLLKNYLFFPNV